MTDDIKVIWKKGDEDMPVKVKAVVQDAQNELLLKTLNLSNETINIIRYNSEKNSQSVSEYISLLVANQLKTA
jgi:hypothetical protein